MNEKAVPIPVGEFELWFERLLDLGSWARRLATRQPDAPDHELLALAEHIERLADRIDEARSGGE